MCKVMNCGEKNKKTSLRRGDDCPKGNVGTGEDAEKRNVEDAEKRNVEDAGKRNVGVA